MERKQKIFSSTSDIAAACAQAKSAGKKVVLTTVVCDLVHPAHFEYMLRARLEGDFLAVGVDSDAYVRRVKGPDRPHNPQAQRVELLSYLDFVDALVVYDDEPELVRAVRPDVLVVSDTSHVQLEDDPPRFAAVQEVGCRVQKFGAFSKVHTTTMLAKIRGQQGPKEGEGG